MRYLVKPSGPAARRKTRAWLSVLLVCLAVVPVAIPIVFSKGEFGGSDEAAKTAIGELNAAYKPWFAPLWQSPSRELEGLFFAVQAAIGSGVICFGLGYLYGRSRGASGRLGSRKPDSGEP